MLAARGRGIHQEEANAADSPVLMPPPVAHVQPTPKPSPSVLPSILMSPCRPRVSLTGKLESTNETSPECRRRRTRRRCWLACESAASWHLVPMEEELKWACQSMHWVGDARSLKRYVCGVLRCLKLGHSGHGNAFGIWGATLLGGLGKTGRKSGPELRRGGSPKLAELGFR